MDYQTQLDWLIAMSSNPGFKDHAWYRAKQLEADFPGIKDALTNHMIGLAATLESENPQAPKPRLVRVK